MTTDAASLCAEKREHYFLSAELGGVKFEKEVSIEDWCKAERQAGFRPKMPSTDNRYMTTPATGGFGGNSISGSIRYLATQVATPAATGAGDDPIGDMQSDARQAKLYEFIATAAAPVNVDGRTLSAMQCSTIHRALMGARDGWLPRDEFYAALALVYIDTMSVDARAALTTPKEG